ncbi:MAG: glycosyltransferase family 2 protein [Oscillospiraceae bacterium]|nr:glycosyltransferase family 2 protein [Oscillospiraceae bacterium]
MKVLSVVIPIYNETGIEPNIARVINVLKSADINYEIILVDDGSKNSAWNEISDIVDKYENVRGIAFSRNFGKESALCAGLDMAEGDCAVCLDSDMQFPPEVIPDMFRLWEQGWEVVEGVKKQRQKEGLMYKLCAGTFYTLLKKLAGIDLRNASDFRLLDRVAIDAWKAMPERQTFFRGMSSWVGFKRIKYEFDVADREIGESKWSLKALINFAIDAVTSYTAAPLYAVIMFGSLFFLFTVIMAIQTLYMKIRGYALGGFTTVIILQLLTSAVCLFGLGVVGVYIKKIYEEVKNRPRYIIRRVIGKEENNNGEQSEDNK